MSTGLACSFPPLAICCQVARLCDPARDEECGGWRYSCQPRWLRFHVQAPVVISRKRVPRTPTVGSAQNPKKKAPHLACAGEKCSRQVGCLLLGILGRAH